MKKVCILIPFYGEWPSFLPLYLKSCENNASISFIFFTDLKPPSSYPSNVNFHHFAFSEIKARMDKLLGFSSALTSPYKLCDVRPAYALIFKEYIKDFDFWGWGDVDLIYGDLNQYITEYRLESMDVISFRKKWLSGSFCLIRNTEFLANLFLRSKDLRLVFETPFHKGFDEISRYWKEILTVDHDAIKLPNDNFTMLLLNAEKEKTVILDFNDYAKESIGKSEFLIWDKGEIKNSNGVIFSHYHFITEKGRLYFVVPSTVQLHDKYYIDRTGFYTEDDFKNRTIIGYKRILRTMPTFLFSYSKRKFLGLKRIVLGT